MYLVPPALRVSMCINLAALWGANISLTVSLEDILVSDIFLLVAAIRLDNTLSEL